MIKQRATGKHVKRVGRYQEIKEPPEHYEGSHRLSIVKHAARTQVFMCCAFCVDGLKDN